MRYSDEAEQRYHSSVLSYVWLGHDDPAQYAPASDPVTGVHVIVGGRLVWPQTTWQRSEKLPYQGGTANRVVLDNYLNKGPIAVAPYNGAAMVLVYDPRDQSLYLWTDQFGYHPAFVYGTDVAKPTVVTSFPDAIRCDPDADDCPDEVSMAEFLCAWKSTPPHTYYRYLKHAGAATTWHWDLSCGAVDRSEYWQPFESGFFESCSEAAEALAAALRIAVSERTAAAKKVGLFVSGGADSRVMLFGADDPSKITGVNLYESKPTDESLVSKALCERVGAKYVGFGRDNDYYPRMLADNVRWSGAMWSSEDSHYLGVQHLIKESGSDLVMTACTTDWVFKGYGLEKTYRKAFGKNLPLKRFLSDRVNGFLPNYPRPAPPELRDQVEKRMAAWFSDCPEQLERDLDRLRVEDRRVRPACYTVSVSGQIMYRTYPYDTFLADSRIAECYARIPASMKLNGDVWGLAAGLVCRGTDDIVDSNNGWAVNASSTTKLIAFARGWVSRRFKAMRSSTTLQSANDHPDCYASWPDLGWYATNSPTVSQAWHGVTQGERLRMTRLWGSDPWTMPLNEWSKTPLDFFRVLTLLQYIRSLSHEPT